MQASCARCARTWSGDSACHCGQCHRSFTSLSAFDAHQTLVHAKAAVRCTDPAGMYRKSGKPVFSWNPTREMWALHSEGYPWTARDDSGRPVPPNRGAAK